MPNHWVSITVTLCPKLIKSFDEEKLIDEVYLYTSDMDIPKSNLKNPLNIDNDWSLKSNKMLGNNELRVFEKKELCLQE